MPGPDLTADVLRTQPGHRARLTPEAKLALRRLERPAGRSGDLSPLGYNLTISHERRFVWFRVAKVATRTLLGYLQEQEVALDVEHAYWMRYPTALFADYVKFGFVRHPLPRFVSAWQDKVVNANYFGFDDATLTRVRERPEAFAAWVGEQDLTDTDQHLALQSRLVDLTQVDFLGRLETFAEDFAELCGLIGLPAVLPQTQHRTATAETPRLLASEELRAAVAELYRRDFQVLGYATAAPSS